MPESLDGNRPRLDLVIPQIADLLRQGEERAYRPRVSSGGRCVRSLTYKALGFQEEPDSESGRVSVLLADGNMHEDSTVEWLAKSSYPVTDRQLGVNIGIVRGVSDEPFPCESCMEMIPGNVLHGHIDGLIRKGNVHLFEHKGLNERGFEKLAHEPNKDYVQQCSCYIHGLRQQGIDIKSAILLIKNKANSAYRQVFIEYEDDQAKITNEWNGRVFFVDNPVADTLQVFETVERHRAAGTLPERPFDYDDWNCRYCGFRNQCWSGLVESIKAREEIDRISDNDFLAVDVSRYFELKQLSSQMEVEIKDLRSSIMREMTARNIKSGKAGGLKFSVSARNAESLDKERIPEEVKRKAMRSYVMRTVSVKQEKV